MWRTVVSIVAGLVTAGLVIGAVEGVAGAIWPPPEGFDPADPVQLDALVASMPLAAKLIVTAGFGLGPLAGAFLGAFMAQQGEQRVALGVGVVMLALTIANLMAIAHPMWMTVAAVILPLPSALLGGWLGARRNRAEAIAGSGAPPE